MKGVERGILNIANYSIVRKRYQIWLSRPTDTDRIWKIPYILALYFFLMILCECLTNLESAFPPLKDQVVGTCVILASCQGCLQIFHRLCDVRYLLLQLYPCLADAGYDAAHFSVF